MILMKRLGAWAVATAIAGAALAACASPQPQRVAFDDDQYAATWCIDNDGYRVPDNYCPIGDGIVAGHPYAWNYTPYYYDSPDVDIVYVGYQVPRERINRQRPAYIATTHIDRGRFPEKPLAGTPRTSGAKVTVADSAKMKVVQTGTRVQRGGLGAGKSTATNAPKPNRSLSSPAPGRGTATVVAASGSSSAPKPVASAPSGSRPTGSSTSSASRSSAGKSGK